MPERLIVHITRVADGETRAVDHGVHPSEHTYGSTTRESAEHWWTDRGGATPYNRYLMFERVNDPTFDGDPDEDPDDDAYTIRFEWKPVD